MIYQTIFVCQTVQIVILLCYNLRVGKYCLAISDLTLLTITHNMSKDILELYDEIIFMADGEIIEHGTFETLIDKHTAFYDFYQLKK